MKTAIMILFIAAFALYAGAGTARADGDSGTLTADVDTVTLAQAQGEDSSIAVIDEYGVKVIFDVTPATIISGPNDEPISLGDIQQNDSVEIEYENLEGGLGVAKSIKLTVKPTE
jgi:hypothetical protein